MLSATGLWLRCSSRSSRPCPVPSPLPLKLGLWLPRHTCSPHSTDIGLHTQDAHQVSVTLFDVLQFLGLAHTTPELRNLSPSQATTNHALLWAHDLMPWPWTPHALAVYLCQLYCKCLVARIRKFSWMTTSVFNHESRCLPTQGFLNLWISPLYCFSLAGVSAFRCSAHSSRLSMATCPSRKCWHSTWRMYAYRIISAPVPSWELRHVLKLTGRVHWVVRAFSIWKHIVEEQKTGATLHFNDTLSSLSWDSFQKSSKQYISYTV